VQQPRVVDAQQRRDPAVEAGLQQPRHHRLPEPALPQPHALPSTSIGGVAVAPPSGVSRSISGLGSSMA
jgi:hypothetical protein